VAAIPLWGQGARRATGLRTTNRQPTKDYHHSSPHALEQVNVSPLAVRSTIHSMVPMVSAQELATMARGLKSHL
jgi:hypothetical protein